MDIENNQMLMEIFNKICETNKDFKNKYMKLLELEKTTDIKKDKDLKNFFKTILKDLKQILEKEKENIINNKRKLSHNSFNEIINPIEDDYEMENFTNSFHKEVFLEIKYEKICLNIIKKKLNKLFKNNFEGISTLYYIIEAIKIFQTERSKRLEKYELIMETYNKGISFFYPEDITKGNLEIIKNFSYYLGYEEINYIDIQNQINKI